MLCLACGCGRYGFTFPDARGGNGDGPAPGDGGGDTPDVSGDAVAGACGTNVLLFDDFEDGTVAPEWTVLAGTGLTVGETGGVLQIAFGNNVPASQTAGYRTAATMDFTDTCVEAELVMPADQTSGAVIELQLGAGQNRIYMDVASGMLETEEQLGAAVYRGTPLPYDPVAHRWLRMREVSGTWYFQVAPDAMTYTTVFSYPQDFGLQTACTLTIAAGSGSAVGNGGIAQWGSVRVTGP